jgi:transcriptional regulator NrdR family protein
MPKRFVAGHLVCPKCRHPKMDVIDSRGTFKGEAVWRRRWCPNCLHRITTYELEISEEQARRIGAEAWAGKGEEL